MPLPVAPRNGVEVLAPWLCVFSQHTQLAGLALITMAQNKAEKLEAS